MWPASEIEKEDFQVIPTDGLTHFVGSVGNLGATGNTFGLHYLGANLAPALERRLPEGGFVIDVFGGGVARPVVARSLERNSIRMHGWVESLKSHVQQSVAFLVLTNAHGFIVGNTRILLAWSLGACVVAHSNSRLSMPELEHDQNILLADNSEEMADLLVEVAADKQLRERIGKQGYETYQRYYRSDRVVPTMLTLMEEVVGDYKGRAAAC